MDIFVLDLLILCLKERLKQTLPIFFYEIIVFKEWWYNFKVFYECLKMIEFNSYETHNIYPNLNDQLKFTLNKINEIKD